MTKFSDDLFDDLMREHRTTLANVVPPTPPAHRISGRQLVLATGGGLAVAAAVAGTLVATGGPAATVAGSTKTPAYAVTQNPDGTLTLTAYQKSGLAGINADLRKLGDKNVYVVPVEPGCPSMSSLPKPPVSGVGHMIGAAIGISRDGSVTVQAMGIPAGDIMVIGMEVSGKSRVGAGTLTSAPPPKCVSLSVPPPSGGSGSGSGSTTTNAG